jgi:hypothetical protein
MHARARATSTGCNYALNRCVYRARMRVRLCVHACVRVRAPAPVRAEAFARACTHAPTSNMCVRASRAAENTAHDRESVTFSDARADGGSNYGTALISNRSLEFVRRALAADVPFFAYIAPHAPHEPGTPAPWYAELYGEAIAPHCGVERVVGG